MRFGGRLITTITSSILLAACAGTGTKTEFTFGNNVPYESAQMHNDLGNVHENTQMNVLAPISENAVSDQAVPDLKPVKVVKPRTPKASLPLGTEAEQLANTNAPVAPAIITTPTATAPVAAAPANWQPNEALLIRGNELIAGLQRELGKKPSPPEMQKRLQTHMGLSAAQAQQVLAALGL